MLNLPPERLRTMLTACLAVDRWVGELVDAAPYDSRETLLSHARDAATPLSATEIDEALAHHPRIGDKAVGEGAAERFSRAEQSFGDTDDASVVAAIAQGNLEYERRFGRVFLIRAKGRTRREILTELDRRLELDDVTELEIVGSELADIALLRLESLLAEVAETPPGSGPVVSSVRSHITSHVLDAALGTPAETVPVALDRLANGEWMPVASAVTDADGRVSSLGPEALGAGTYRVTFDTATYLAATQQPVFYPEVVVQFVVSSAAEHYHIPLLLSPFSYSTYRGS